MKRKFYHFEHCHWYGYDTQPPGCVCGPDGNYDCADAIENRDRAIDSVKETHKFIRSFHDAIFTGMKLSFVGNGAGEYSTILTPRDIEALDQTLTEWLEAAGVSIDG